MSEMTPTVLVVEDEPGFVDALSAGLQQEGFVVRSATDGEEALSAVEEHDPDLVLLDVMLPKMSGIDVCRELRARSSRVPVLMVSARSSEIDTVVGLEVGADDYIAKPYRMRELVARIHAVLRRSSYVNKEMGPAGTLELDHIVYDTVRHEVKVNGVVTAMPMKEFELLGVLLANAGRVLSREVLIRKVWGADYVGDTKTLDVHIKRLRAKVEPNPGVPTFIGTIRGLGYKWESQTGSTGNGG